MSTAQSFLSLLSVRSLRGEPCSGEQVLREVETHFANGVAVARLADVDDDEIRSILELALTQREDA